MQHYRHKPDAAVAASAEKAMNTIPAAAASWRHLQHAVRSRVLGLLERSNASVAFGAELNAYEMAYVRRADKLRPARRVPQLFRLDVPGWASERCPHLVDSNGPWLEAHSDCSRLANRAKGQVPCRGAGSYSNPNSGLVAGFACELRQATRAIATAPELLEGALDQVH